MPKVERESAAPPKPPCNCCSDLANLRAAFADATRAEDGTGNYEESRALRERAFDILAKHVAEKHHDIEK